MNLNNILIVFIDMNLLKKGYKNFRSYLEPNIHNFIIGLQ